MFYGVKKLGVSTIFACATSWLFCSASGVAYCQGGGAPPIPATADDVGKHCQKSRFDGFCWDFLNDVEQCDDTCTLTTTWVTFEPYPGYTLTLPIISASCEDQDKTLYDPTGNPSEFGCDSHTVVITDDMSTMFTYCEQKYVLCGFSEYCGASCVQEASGDFICDSWPSYDIYTSTLDVSASLITCPDVEQAKLLRKSGIYLVSN